jgi:hypothetical protein
MPDGRRARRADPAPESVARVWARAGAHASMLEDDPRVRHVVRSFIEEYYQGA